MAGAAAFSRARAVVRDRPYHVAVGSLGAGLALAEAGPGLALAAAALTAAMALACRAEALAPVAAALVLAGAALGHARLASLDAPAERLRDGHRAVLRTHLLTPPRPGPLGSSAEVRVTAGPLRNARLLLRIPRWAHMPSGVEIGAELRVEGKLRARSGPVARRPRRQGPRFDYAAFLRRRGLAGELLADRVRATGARRGAVAGALDRMRERAERAVVAGMAPPEANLLRGMVLGQDEAVPESVREDFRASGLAHILAVSGQNVMLLAALALPFLMLGGLGPRGRLVALAGLIALYVPLAGAGPSLQRAGVMGLAGLAAMAASRPSSRWYALLLAATVTLAWNPRAWSDPGWQLSFAAVAGILTLGVPLQRAMRRAAEELAAGESTHRPFRVLLRALADGVAITVAATLATAPLLAHHFGSVSLASLPANLLALPAVAPAMWLGMLKIAIGQLGPPAAPVAEALGGLAELPVAYLAWLAERFAAMPAGQLGLALPSPLALLAAYALLALGAAAAVRAGRRSEPRLAEHAARWRRLPSARRSAAAALAAALLLAATSAVLGSPGPPGRLTVRFLDVGQGDSVLIQHPDGTAVLFDGGPPEAGVARLLRRAGVERLALVVATHASRDHHGGLAEVLRSVPVGTLLDGGDGSPDPSFRALLREADARGVRRVRATAPLELTMAGGELRIRILSPAPRPPGPAPEDPNPRAVVALVSAGRFDLLLSADAESESLLPLELPEVEAMKVPHHGSADPGLAELLNRLEPELAAIEVGPNTYGHPAPSTLAALERAGVRTYRTDHDGTITLSLGSGSVAVDTER